MAGRLQMKKKCLKCGHEQEYGNMTPASDCPKCGAIYEKVESALKKEQILRKEQTLKEERALSKTETPNKSQADEKKCKQCAMMIPKKAKICPYCRKKIGLTTPATVGIVVIALAIFGSIIGEKPGKTPKNNPAPPSKVSRPAPPAQPAQRYIMPQPREVKDTIPTPPIIVDAATLFSEYEENEVRADERYKGKNLQISGSIDSVGKDILDHMYVTLNAGKQIFHIQCFFDKSHANTLASLNKGTFVTVVGQCDGKFGNILLKGCTLR